MKMAVKKAYAHPITETGKGKYLESKISSFLNIGDRKYSRGITARRHKNGVSLRCKEYSFRWFNNKLEFSISTMQNIEEVFSKALITLDTMAKYSQKRYDHELIAV